VRRRERLRSARAPYCAGETTARGFNLGYITTRRGTGTGSGASRRPERGRCASSSEGSSESPPTRLQAYRCYRERCKNAVSLRQSHPSDAMCAVKGIQGSVFLGVVKPVDVLDYAQRHQAAVHPGTLVVSLDECYFSEKVMPLYGYSTVGECCKVRNKRGGRTKRSLILGIGSDGSCVHQVVLGSVKRTTFEAFVLSLTYPPGTVLLMDNCTVHKKLETAFSTKGYLALFLSPYSPSFQPVELAFSKVKGIYRRMWPWGAGVDSAVVKSVA
jgi:hypothetical protein